MLGYLITANLHSPTISNFDILLQQTVPPAMLAPSCRWHRCSWLPHWTFNDLSHRDPTDVNVACDITTVTTVSLCIMSGLPNASLTFAWLGNDLLTFLWGVVQQTAPLHWQLPHHPMTSSPGNCSDSQGQQPAPASQYNDAVSSHISSLCWQQWWHWHPLWNTGTHTQSWLLTPHRTPLQAEDIHSLCTKKHDGEGSKVPVFQAVATAQLP